MAAIYRLTAVACQEVADVKQTKRELDEEWARDLADGVITPEEAARLTRKLRQLDREIAEAVVVVEEADYVEAEYEYRKKRGMRAETHQYLREREHDIRDMGGLQDYPPKRPSPAGARAFVVVGKRKALQAPIKQVRRESNR